MFGVRWAVLPADVTPPAGSIRSATAGRWVLWSTGDIGYLSMVDTVAPVAVDRTNLGLQMARFLISDLPLAGSLSDAGVRRRAGRRAHARSRGRSHDPGGERDDDDRAARRWSLRRRRARRPDGRGPAEGAFDPRWTVTVDGRDVPTEIIAPGFVGVRLDPGDHRVLFVYHAYPFYWLLFALGAVVMIALVVIERRFLRPPRPHDVVPARPRASSDRPANLLPPQTAGARERVIPSGYPPRQRRCRVPRVSAVCGGALFHS